MKKILIVEDDEDMRTILKTMLSGKYEVNEAASAREGKEKLADFSPDLLILDVMMEELDSGFQLARSVRQEQGLENIKILMTTSIDNEMKINFKKSAGDESWLPVDDYIVKPLKKDEVLGKIEALIGK
jgi:CheY-like chemotaxis protein